MHAMHTIKPSIVPFQKRRRPFLTRETRPDPANDGGMVSVAVVNVLTPGGAVAQIDLEDFNPIMEGGFSDQMWMHSNGREHSYLRTSHPNFPNTTFTVARLILGGAQGNHVRYRNHNPLDLRRSNLVVREGASKGNEAAALAETPADEGAF